MQHPMQDHGACSPSPAEQWCHGSDAIRLAPRIDDRGEEIERAPRNDHRITAPERGPVAIRGHRELPGPRAAGVDQCVEQHDRHEHQAGAAGIGDEPAHADARDEIGEHRGAEHEQPGVPFPAHASWSSGVAAPA